MKKNLYVCMIVILAMSSCNKYNIKYDEQGNIISMDDPGKYSTFDKFLIKIGCHEKTDAYISYHDFLIGNDMEEVATIKIKYAVSQDSNYWLVHYVIGYDKLQNNELDHFYYAWKDLRNASLYYDEPRLWNKVEISKENTYRNRAYYYFKNGDYYTAIEKAKEALLLCDKNTDLREINLNLIIRSYIKIKHYDNAIKWAAKIDNIEKRDSLKLNLERIKQWNDDVDNKVFPDYELYKFFCDNGYDAKTYRYFISHFTKNVDNIHKLYNLMIDEKLYKGSYESFYEKYFAYYDKYRNDYFYPIHLEIKLMK